MQGLMYSWQKRININDKVNTFECIPGCLLKVRLDL